MIQNEKEVLETLRLPSIPLKEWDGKKSFGKGVAILNLRSGGQAYAIVTFDAQCNEKPIITKVFALEQFVDIQKILVVPEYMDDDVDTFDLNEESMEAARMLASEALELENEEPQEESEDDGNVSEHPYYFENIHSDEEASAFIKAYNKRHSIVGRIPTTHDGLVMRLYAIYNESQKNSRGKKNNK